MERGGGVHPHQQQQQQQHHHHHHNHQKYYRKGLWTEEEDKILMDYIMVHGKGKWNRVAKITGLKRCGKSCRLRWMNYLSPNVKRGDFSEQEEDLIIRLHKLLGNRWSLIAGRVPGRTDNQVKNHWNTHLSKKLGIKMGMINKTTNINGVSSTSTSTSTYTTYSSYASLITSTNIFRGDSVGGDNKQLHLMTTEDDSNNTKKLQTSENGNGGSTTTITTAAYDETLNLKYNNNFGQETPPATATATAAAEMDDSFLSSFWILNEEDKSLNTSSTPYLLEIPDGYPLDVIWHGCSSNSF